MKKLMILGAGIYQVPLIKRAKEMGHYVIVVSINGNYPGFPFADKIYYQDTTVVEKVIEIAKKEKIDGICTTGTDVALLTVGSVIEELKLTGISSKSALLATNKLEMKQRFIENDVCTSKFMKCSSVNDAIHAFETLNKPVIFKAVDNSGSRGTIKVETINDVRKAMEAVMNVTKLPYFIVEEFIEGIEFGAQAFIYNHELSFILPHGDMVFCKDGKSVPIGHYVPYNISRNVMNDIHIQLENSIKALEINDSAINADFILKDDKVYVLEIGARAGATCLPEMVSAFYGFDYYEQMINTALGERPEFIYKEQTPCAVELIISEKSGILDHIEEVNITPNQKIDLSFDVKPGDEIRKFNEGNDRIGKVVIKGETIEEAFDLLDKVKSGIELKFSKSIKLVEN
ncbi:ATP-grasp domain-containing protein [Bacillus sp. BRMEA1]|uniref:ATP-grasp domain-containing protein n=1 Tax=Neobacillus endophyticus TaxID=2738405 RepID=UPI0015638B6F|nr:ATP-grasp domain-containing protein [Neobacillus endophyticus]NRD76324.1 ATP-grasp domain-containing protein [Neobacillus endophyticus]